MHAKLQVLTNSQFIDNGFSIYPFTEEAALTGLDDPIDSGVYGSVYCSKEFLEFCVYSHTEGDAPTDPLSVGASSSTAAMASLPHQPQATSATRAA